MAPSRVSALCRVGRMAPSRGRPHGDLEIVDVTPDSWADLVDLFERPGPRGSWPRASACYCMFWRMQPADYEAAFRQRSLESRSGGPNKEAMKRLIARGDAPGLLAYRDGRAAGWASVSPRADLVRLEHSPQLRSADGDDDERTWAVSCFYVHRSDWRSGVGTALLAAAVERATAPEHGRGLPRQGSQCRPLHGLRRHVRPGRVSSRAPGKGARARALAEGRLVKLRTRLAVTPLFPLAQSRGIALSPGPVFRNDP